MSGDRSGRVGFMQGRLLPPFEGRIQAFPRGAWAREFEIASARGFPFLEWIFEAEDYERNPLWTAEGVERIRAVSAAHGVRVASVMADYFMERPLFRGNVEDRRFSAGVLEILLDRCGALGIPVLEIPMVDGARLEGSDHENALADALLAALPRARARGVRLSLETDLPPARVRKLLDRPGLEEVGANYDMGNSAALCYDPVEEIAAYGERILNVHVKDRRRGGGSVPLGEGDACAERVIAALKRIFYAGPFVLQTARAPGADAEVLCRYRDRVEAWLAA